MLKNFAMCVIETSMGSDTKKSEALLVLKHDDSMLKFEAGDQDCISVVSKIKSDDNVHRAWKSFSSILELDSFLLEHNQAYHAEKQASNDPQTNAAGYVNGIICLG